MYIYLISIAIRPAISGFDRKPAQKLSLVVTFVPSESIYTYFFFEIFVTSKKITHLYFQSILKIKYRKCKDRKTLVFPKFSNSLILGQSFLYTSIYVMFSHI